MAVTIHDIAEYTRLNASTVSRVLRNDSRISEKTSRRVREAVEKLGYVSNIAARNLASGKTNSVAFIIGNLEDYHVLQAAVPISEMLSAAGYTFMILPNNGHKKMLEDTVTKLEQRICDAAVIAPPQEDFIDSRMLERLKGLPVPLIFFDRWLEQVPAPAVTTDNRTALGWLVKAVLDYGIDGAFVSLPAANTVGRSRYSGECALLESYGIPYCSDIEELSDFVSVNKVKSLGVFADSPWRFPMEKCEWKEWRPERIVGGMFDRWENYPPDFFERIFLCVQDFPAMGKACGNIVLDILAGKAVPAKITTVKPDTVISVPHAK